jgi:hypothetical protein
MSANAHLPLAGVRCCGCWLVLVLVLVLLTSSTQRQRHDSSVFT